MNAKTRLLVAAAALVTACSNSHNDPAPLVKGLHFTQVAAYQTLETIIMKDGAAVDQDVPIIQGRATKLRAFVAPDAGWDGREVIVRFSLTVGGKALAPMDVRKKFTTASSDGDLATSADVDLKPEQVTGDLTFAVSLHEVKAGPTVKVETALYPVVGQAALGAHDTGDGEHIVVIPVEYDADGSARLPDTSQPQLDILRAKMKVLYPVRDVQITVGAPLKWSTAVQASGRGWGRLLNAVLNQRANDNVASNVYYYGLFAPASSFETYCSGGCVTGLSPTSPDPADDMSRGSIGLDYDDKQAESDVTFVHEVGHAHGLLHAPCGMPMGIDQNFPYADGGIGDWGYDSGAGMLWDPSSDVRDMMGYCTPVWISDYSYKLLYNRVTYLNTPARVLHRASRWRTVVIDGDEAVRGGVVTTAAIGQASSVERVGDEGSERVPARFYPFDHLAGGILLIPEEADVGTLRFGDLTIQ